MELVLREIEKEYTDEIRAVDRLKRDLESLPCRKVPIEDLRYPEDVPCVNRIRYWMTERADVGDRAEATQVVDEAFASNGFESSYFTIANVCASDTGTTEYHSTDGQEVRKQSPKSTEKTMRTVP